MPFTARLIFDFVRNVNDVGIVKKKVTLFIHLLLSIYFQKSIHLKCQLFYAKVLMNQTHAICIVKTCLGYFDLFIFKVKFKLRHVGDSIVFVFFFVRSFSHSQIDFDDDIGRNTHLLFYIFIQWSFI